MKHRFPIGTQYSTREKHAKVCTITEQLTTTNSKGEIVAIRYLSSHEFCGQQVTNSDVLDTTIARGLLPAFQHLLKD